MQSWTFLLFIAVVVVAGSDSNPLPAQVEEQSCEKPLMSAPKVKSFATAAQLSADLGSAVAALAAKAPSDKPFTVAISGGSLPKLLAAGIVGSPLADSIKWSNWHVFFADERVVALDHDDSNFKSCKEKLFAQVGIPENNIYPINPALDTAEAVASDYTEKLASVFGDKINAESPPAFDLILLGMGPDGHTASLFPDHELLTVKDRLVAHIEDSPKPPPKRVTLTYPVLNAGKTTMFVCTGGGKAPSLAKILTTPAGAPDQLPAGRIAPTNGDLIWYVDDAASADYSGPKL